MIQLTDEVFAQVREALAMNRVMGRDADGNYTRDCTPKKITAAIAALDTAQPVQVNAMLVEALKDTMYSLQVPPVSCQQGVVSKCKCRTCAVARGDTALTAAKQAQPEPKMVTPYITQEHFDRVFPDKQAQPERAPLSYWQVAKAFLKREQPTQPVDIFRSGVRFAEKHHGIKQGGQHD